MLEDFRVVDDAIDHGSCDGDVSEALSPLGKVRLDVTMMDPCSYRRETSWKNRFAASASTGM